MAATPLAMQQCGLSFDDTALVLEWHVIGMFAPGFFTGALIKRFGTLSVMGAGVVLNALCIAIALMGVELHQFVIALFVLGVGWNFLFTASTTLSFSAYAPEEKDRAQAVINFGVFAVMATLASVIKRDLSGMGKWLFVGALVLMVGGIVNIFVGSTAGMMALSVAAIGIFSAYMLYDLKQILDGGETNYISATLMLYMDLFNVFQSLLALLGIMGGDRD
jgi:FtsH-binding integral membrane protein